VTVEDFESLVLSQRPAASAWQPVTDYSYEARKAIEGEQPRLILEVFQPSRMLDVGCGFNYLPRLVNELAGERIAYGADVSNRAADYRYDITAPDVPHIGGDLIVCREVLEHLTVRQIRRAIGNLCALSSRFVYVTTRFAKNPTHLLDVDTADDLDPTHISMCNKDFVRLMFALEGFKRRADLEARMDWMQKGRCLVYERV
jgi:SAM-dependent methyltransferase